MKKFKFLFLAFCALAVQSAWAQEVLPKITVKDFNGRIIVSWQNAYNVPVANISIQRSYDSSKNFSTIGSVLNPQNLENGFTDDKPPYNKMYYRAFISFEGGSYVFSATARPVKVIPPKPVEVTVDTSATDSRLTDSAASKTNLPNFPWNVSASKDSLRLYSKKDSLVIKNNVEVITYPSQRIYTGKDNNLVLHLKDAPNKKYSVKFFDESDSLLFELTKLKEEYLIVEKVNFAHSGWFHFELFESGKLVEKNRFFIGRDGKSSSGELYRKTNK